VHIEDKIVSWFIRNIILPRNEIIDNPGFIILKISKEKDITNLREILIPEYIIAEIEKIVVEKYKEIGKQILYSIGKKFGYEFALASYYPHTKNEKEFTSFSYFLVRYLEAIYADKITHEIDFKNKKFILKSWNWIVCNKNGLGFIFSDGTASGMLAYAFQDHSIEGVQTRCQGRGDEYCEILCAPESYLKDIGINFLKERDLLGLEINRKVYNDMNKIRSSYYAKNSLRSLLDMRSITYVHGKIEYKGERLLLIESSIMYILEKELKKLENGLKILWDISFDWGKELSKKAGKQDPAKFIMDFFPALGFGDIFVKKNPWRVLVNYFPWTKWADEIDFVIFRGIFSGIITELSGKVVNLKKFKKNISSQGFSIIIEE